MPYYPKTKIQTDLFANGELVRASDLTPYVGPYYKLSTGQKYVGINPQSNRYPEELINPIELGTTLEQQGLFTQLQTSFVTTSSINTYVQNLELPPTNQRVPVPYYPQPTSQSYQIGYFDRYFAKQVNASNFIEVDKTTFENLAEHNSEYLWQLYNVTSIPWQISGNVENIYKTNRNLVRLSEKNGFDGLSLYLKGNYIKFYQGPDKNKDISSLINDNHSGLETRRLGDMR